MNEIDNIKSIFDRAEEIQKLYYVASTEMRSLPLTLSSLYEWNDNATVRMILIRVMNDEDNCIDIPTNKKLFDSITINLGVKFLPIGVGFTKNISNYKSIYDIKKFNCKIMIIDATLIKNKSFLNNLIQILSENNETIITFTTIDDKNAFEYKTSNFFDENDPKIIELNENNRELYLANFLHQLNLDFDTLITCSTYFENHKEISQYILKNYDKVIYDNVYTNDYYRGSNLHKSDFFEMIRIAKKYDPFNNDLIKFLIECESISSETTNLSTYKYINELIYFKISNSEDNLDELIKKIENNKKRNDVVLTDFIWLLNLMKKSFDRKSDYLKSYTMFIDYYNSKTYLNLCIFLGTYIYSELKNNGFIKEGNDVIVKLNELFSLNMAKYSSNFKYYFKDIYIAKNTFKFNIMAYEPILYKMKLLIDSKDNNIIANNDVITTVYSNYIGINIYEATDCKNEIEEITNYIEVKCKEKFTLDIIIDSFNIDTNISSTDKAILRLNNNISVTKCKGSKNYTRALENFVDNYNSIGYLHPIICNNLIGFILSSKDINQNKKIVKKLFTIYRQLIIQKREVDFYGYFFNINLMIANKLLNDSIEIDNFKITNLSKLYDDTPYYEFLHTLSKNDFKASSFKEFVQEFKLYSGYEYPYNYLFIDFQDWSFF